MVLSAHMKTTGLIDGGHATGIEKLCFSPPAPLLAPFAVAPFCLFPLAPMPFSAVNAPFPVELFPRLLCSFR